MTNPNLTRATNTVRRRRMTFPKVDNAGEDAIVARYRLEGALTTSFPGGSANIRQYVAGNPNGLRRAGDPGIVMSALYSTYKYMPGTKVRWEPTCGSTTPGRVVYCWVDNPEKMYNLRLAFDAYISNPTPVNFGIFKTFVTGVGNCRSFPVWMETEIQMPTDTRRKRFDSDFGLDSSSTSTAINTLDRSCQKSFYYYIDGVLPEDVELGSMWYHDVVHLQGLNTTPT